VVVVVTGSVVDGKVVVTGKGVVSSVVWARMTEELTRAINNPRINSFCIFFLFVRGFNP